MLLVAHPSPRRADASLLTGASSSGFWSTEGRKTEPQAQQPWQQQLGGAEAMARAMASAMGGADASVDGDGSDGSGADASGQDNAGTGSSSDHGASPANMRYSAAEAQ